MPLIYLERVTRMLSEAQKRDYQRDGYVVIEDFKSPDQIALVRERAAAIVTGFDANAGRSIFTTRDQALATDRYFLESADQVRCFFEEEAFAADGSLRQPKELSINKIAHALHDRDPLFDRFSRGPELAELALDLGLEQPLIWQSMYIFKQPGIGGEVGWHQDATFLHTDPISVTTFWFALEDASLENGCLWVEPGGHRGPLRELFIREGRGAQGTHRSRPMAGGGSRCRLASQGRQPGVFSWPVAALQRAQSLEQIAPRLFAARDRCAHALCEQQLVAAQGRVAVTRVSLRLRIDQPASL